MQGPQGRPDTESVEQPRSTPRVLGVDPVDLGESRCPSRRQVAQIADRCPDQVEGSLRHASERALRDSMTRRALSELRSEPGSESGFSDVLQDLLFQVLLRKGSDYLVHDLTVLEVEDAGNGGDIESARRDPVRVNVELSHLDLALVLLREFLDDRTHHSAWTTPLSPEVHDRQTFTGFDLVREVLVRDFPNIFSRHLSLSDFVLNDRLTVA
jgi:hypothetical protein